MNEIGIPSDFNPKKDIIRAKQIPGYSWNVLMINAAETHKKGYTGKGIKYAVLDTGYKSHPDLPDIPENRTWSAYGSVTDKNGHGTHCLGIIAMQPNEAGYIGVAYDAIPYVGKVLNDDGSGTFRNVAKGIRWAVDYGCKVISLSLGASHTARSREVDEAINYAWNKGCICVIASGNENSNKVGYPARHEKAISVGAVDKNKLVARFSNKGKLLDIVAPGVNIISSWNNGDYIEADGTSMACPHVAGVCILYIEYFLELFGKYPTPQETINHMFSNAIDLGAEGKDHATGKGLVASNLEGEKREVCEANINWFQRIIGFILNLFS